MAKWDTPVMPLEPGYAILTANAPPQVGPGSIGGFIYSPKKRAYYVLSNAHVLAPRPVDANSARWLYQPGPSPSRKKYGSNLISVEIDYQPIREPPAVNYVDVGLALLPQIIQVNAKYEFGPEGNRVRGITGIRDAEVDEALTLCSHQWPQTSFVEKTGVNDVVIPYGDVGATFSGLVKLEAGASKVSIGGASGAFFVSPKDGKVVLLCFTGGEERDYGYGIPIRTVLEWVTNRLKDDSAGILGSGGIVFGLNGTCFVQPFIA